MRFAAYVQVWIKGPHSHTYLMWFVAVSRESDERRSVVGFVSSRSVPPPGRGADVRKGVMCRFVDSPILLSSDTSQSMIQDV